MCGACGGDHQASATAEKLWREAAAYDRGCLRPVAPGTVRTPVDFVAEIKLLLTQAGLLGVRAVDDATARAGCRVSRSTLSRWLNTTTQVMPAKILDSLLTACDVAEADREVWQLARARAERAAEGLSANESGPEADRPAMYVVDNMSSMDPGVTHDKLITDLGELRKGRGALRSSVVIVEVGNVRGPAAGLAVLGTPWVFLGKLTAGHNLYAEEGVVAQDSMLSVVRPRRGLVPATRPLLCPDAVDPCTETAN